MLAIVFGSLSGILISAQLVIALHLMVGEQGQCGKMRLQMDEAELSPQPCRFGDQTFQRGRGDRPRGEGSVERLFRRDELAADGAGFGVHNGKQGLDSVCLRRGQADLRLQLQEMGGAGKTVKLRRFGEAPTATGRQVSDVFLREGLDGAALFAAIRCRVACCQGHTPGDGDE